MDENLIRDKLLERAKVHIQTPQELHQFTKTPQADELISDLKTYPHAYVLACIMDRQIKAEKAWLIPFKIKERMGQSFTMDALSSLNQDDIKDLMNKPTPLHRFGNKMSECLYLGIQRIKNQYNSDASKIWSNKPSSAEVVNRFLEFEGVGPKIATMATNILVRFFRIEFSDYYSIDISVDVHIRRVFGRLGLCTTESTIEQVIYKARKLNPEYPGLIDLPCWEIGRIWCRPGIPDCDNCYMNEVCPKVGVK